MSRSEPPGKFHIDSATFRKVVLTLHMCEMIEEECIARNKIVYILRMQYNGLFLFIESSHWIHQRFTSEGHATFG